MKNLEKLIGQPVVSTLLPVPGRKVARTISILIISAASLVLSIGRVQAQCGVGTQQAILNWDYLDFLVYTGSYTSANGYLQNNTWAGTQYFAFGTQRLTIAHNYSDANSFGENTSHSGEAGTFGNQNPSATDADIQFRGPGTIILTFENEVTNMRFSMYDIDRQHQVQLDARNAANVQQNVSMATFSGSIAVTNNNTPTALATANNTSVASTSNAATIDITIAGPVRRVTINIIGAGTGSGENGDVWISDILACSAGTFPNNYYQVSRPFTGQPGYVLHAFDKGVYAVDPATGRTKLLFTDPEITGTSSSTNSWFVNSMGYDPYNRILYYVFSLTSNPSANRKIKKYDFNTGTISTILADVNTIGIPTTTTRGVESGAGAFFNGSYYIGIETSNSGRTSSREAVVWRVDFNASNIPYRASQVFAVPVDDGSGDLIHDWSDFAISNGILYDFDGAILSDTYDDVYEYDMMTGVTTRFVNPAGYTPGQNATGWDDRVWQIFSSTNPENINPYIAPYNKGLGTEGTRLNLFSTPAFTPTIPSLGDAAEAFRPLMDFGDAPASYDPDPLAPAVHETLANLRLGSTRDIEWLGQNSALADGDGADEDGLGAAPPLLNYLGTLTYSISVNVFNNTGANATLAGWLDYNFNNVFDPGEGVTALVPSSTVSQLVTLTWNNITVPNTSNVRTFVRFRLAPVADGMTVNNPTGYIPNGEVEDYPVLLGVALPNANLKLQASKDRAGFALLNWEHESDIPVKEFRVQKSDDGRNWQRIGTVAGTDKEGKQGYQFTDASHSNASKSYYRLEMLYSNGRIQYSVILSVQPDLFTQPLKISPNPASHSTSISLYVAAADEAQITLTDQSGRRVWNNVYRVARGNNTLLLGGLEKLGRGMYYVTITTNEKTETTKLMISR
jgi:hypothetical protein